MAIIKEVNIDGMEFMLDEALQNKNRKGRSVYSITVLVGKAASTKDLGNDKEYALEEYEKTVTLIEEACEEIENFKRNR